MTDNAAASPNGDQPTAEQAALAAEPASRGGTGPAPAATPPLPATADERPELVVGAAFAGGLALAFLLKRLGR